MLVFLNFTASEKEKYDFCLNTNTIFFTHPKDHWIILNFFPGKIESWRFTEGLLMDNFIGMSGDVDRLQWNVNFYNERTDYMRVKWKWRSVCLVKVGYLLYFYLFPISIIALPCRVRKVILFSCLSVRFFVCLLRALWNCSKESDQYFLFQWTQKWTWIKLEKIILWTKRV